MLSLFPMFSVRRRALICLRELSENSWTKIPQFLRSQIEDTSYLVSRHLFWLGKFRLSNIFRKKNNTFALFPFSVLSLLVLLPHLYIFQKSHVLYTAVNAFSLSYVNITSFLICGLPYISYNFWAELSRFLFRVTIILVTFLLYFSAKTRLYLFLGHMWSLFVLLMCEPRQTFPSFCYNSHFCSFIMWNATYSPLYSDVMFNFYFCLIITNFTKIFHCFSVAPSLPLLWIIFVARKMFFFSCFSFNKVCNHAGKLCWFLQFI